ncbi:MAG: zinc metalloprotease HtpX [Candidatus Zixiibacteriota bacterium]|nr:MAG: zinc metalloprotease HtpX [candidate division Zixibacteria bacterium]
MNGVKTAVLLTILTVILLLVGQAMGGKGGMTVALIFALGINFISYWFSDKIVLAMYRARQISEADNPRLYSLVRSVSQKASLPMPRLYIIPSESPNAFATGRNPDNAAVAVTEGILKALDDEELEGVLSHEFAHIRNRDILIQTIAATIAGAISYLAFMARWAAFFRGGRDDDKGGILGLLAVAILAPIAAVVVQMAISRSREYAADEGAARISHKPLSLANALEKLHAYSRKVPLAAQPATAHLFIVNPLSGRGLASLFSTHPPLEERIKRLEALARRS